MGMFDGLLGGIVGAGMVSVVNDIITKHGGVQGVVNEFERNGLGATVKSWVSTGPNQPISPDDVQRTLGPDLLQQLSAKSGLSVSELAQKLSHVLPQAVDKMTPDGSIPKG
ncbi:MAG: YidB family protein [Vicinamibacterales bacterium]